ncbi:hypothetical protein [Anaeromyxobacter sp. Fw109-5]|uniref:hypothetical protein n=1 Tax=Anaeromyxobacter sp. (strain Fw109-5) TaxID=404589 RepID=UPI0000ED732E|nr:hypothetical protein [Anaeromyxobacter sp. Fw109-5]
MRMAAAALVLVGVLGACGGDDGGGGGPAGLRGTVLGQPFEPSDGAALRLTEEACLFETELSDVEANASALLVGFGTFGGLCDVARQTQACGGKANATTVSVLVLRANVLGGAAGAVEPGTYPISRETPVPDAQGRLTFATALVSRTDATCADTSGAVEPTGGSITIDRLSERVTGNASVTFTDGGSVSGPFDVPFCAFSTDVCTGLGAGCGAANEICVP